MPRSLAAILLGTCALFVAACDSGAVTTTPSPTAQTIAPVVYTLQRVQMTGYAQTLDIAITPAMMADSDKQSQLPATLSKQGFITGARSSYGPGDGATPPFALVQSDAYEFSSASGAKSFFSDEQQRIDQAPTGGTIANVSVPVTNTDQRVAYTANIPADTGATPGYADILLARHGSIVVELFVSNPTSADALDFGALVGAQESLLTP